MEKPPMPKIDLNEHFISKELSWLSFNARVLQEAANKKTPVIQRLRYLGIFSNNLDEFFRVRVADVSRLAAFSSKTETKEHYKKLLSDIQKNARRLQKEFDRTYLEVLEALQDKKIYLINELQLNPEQSSYVETLFHEEVLPQLDPVVLEPGQPFPDLVDGSNYLAVKLQLPELIRYAIIEVPTYRLPRFFQIPHPKGSRSKVFIVLENIIRHCLPKVFRGIFQIDKAEAYTFKITLDAELELGEGINQSLIDKVAHSLKKRRVADPERFVYDRNIPKDLLDYLIKRLKLGKYDSLMPGGRYHNAKDFMDFPAVGPSYLEFKPLPQVPVAEMQQCQGNIFDCIRERDVLLYYPYHSFDTIIDLLKTAAIDPGVKSIHISLYRVAKHSRVVDALLSARRNHKKVTAVVELQARFDEAANIDWARQLTEGGVNVIFGVPGLKVHCKLILISRQENNVLKYYTHVGTGNFNEKTAAVYTDFSLLTYDQEVGEDAAKVLDFISYNYRRHSYNQLMVSPHSNRQGMVRRIKREIGNAKGQQPAAITIKCNNLVDEEIIKLLYKASGAGVKIRIICRGMCSLIPGIPEISENIEVISIVDRFLEHPRVFVFHNAGAPEYFISSADLMTRNLDYRVEVSAPINDPALQQRIQDILDIQWCDNVKARHLDKTQSNQIRKNKLKAKIRSQEVIHQYLEEQKLPNSVQRFRKRSNKL